MREQRWGPDKHELAAIAGNPSVSGLYWAVASGSPPDVVGEYVAQLLNFKEQTLKSAGKLALLQAEFRERTVLHCAVEGGRADMVQAFLRAVLKAPEALTRGDRYELLLSPSSWGAASPCEYGCWRRRTS